MTDAKILSEREDAPHLELNQDGSTIDLSNWAEPANRNWAYRHITDVLPYTVPVAKGDGPILELPEAFVDLSGLRVAYHGQHLLLEEYLFECHANGLIVLQNGNIVHEQYPRMGATERHLCQSVTKTTVCCVIGGLIDEGLVDSKATVDSYLPDVTSGFRGVRLQDCLDMNVALKFDEDFTNPDADIFFYEKISGWHPNETTQNTGILDYLKRIELDPDCELDGVTLYLCPNTDVLVAIAEQVTGKPFTQLFEERIYSRLGAERNAAFCVDPTGMAIGSGGLIVTLRDLARYGHMIANMGIAADGTQVVPLAWLEECRNQFKGTQYYLGAGYRYHNQMTSDGKAFCHLGVCGQMLYANPETGVVVAQFSTTTMPSQGDLDFGNALYDCARVINEYLHEH